MKPEDIERILEIEKEQKLINKGLVKFRKKAGEKAKAFLDFHRISQSKGALSNRFRELIRLAIVTEEGCYPCILKHLRLAFAEGATEEEVIDAMVVLLSMRGGMVYEYIGFVMEAMEYLKQKEVQDGRK